MEKSRTPMGSALFLVGKGLPLPLSWTQNIESKWVTWYPFVQNRHSKGVTAKIVIRKELEGQGTGPRDQDQRAGAAAKLFFFVYLYFTGLGGPYVTGFENI
jgi:hypothetical protein